MRDVERQACFDRATSATRTHCLKIHSMARELKLRIIVETRRRASIMRSRRVAAAPTKPIKGSARREMTWRLSLRPRSGTASPTPWPPSPVPLCRGPAAGDFVYLDIGTCAGQTESCWSRRLKVPLAGITMKMIAAGGGVEARVPGTGRDGGPSCATVKDFDGWKPVKR
jgi:hypothetical protein